MSAADGPVHLISCKVGHNVPSYFTTVLRGRPTTTRLFGGLAIPWIRLDSTIFTSDSGILMRNDALLQMYYIRSMNCLSGDQIGERIAQEEGHDSSREYCRVLHIHKTRQMDAYPVHDPIPLHLAPCFPISKNNTVR